MRYLETDTTKRISKIGLGTWQFGSAEWGYGDEYSKRQACAIVRRAVELGVTLFDTAEIYNAGNSERILGHALGSRRESVFIADKIFPVTPGVTLMKQRAMASAKRLGVPQLDLYQVHYPNPVVSDRGIMRRMRASQRAGLVTEVGVSNYSVERWQSAENALGSRILSNQVQYNLADRSAENDLLPFAETHDRIVIAYSPLAQGLLSGRYQDANRPGDRVRATSQHFRPESMERTKPLIGVLREIAEGHRATSAQIALAWTIRHPFVAAIPGASSIEQMEMNAAAAEISLSDDEYQALHTASLWSCGTSRQRSLVRRKLSELKHCARGGRYLTETLWRDSFLKDGPAPGRQG